MNRTFAKTTKNIRRFLQVAPLELNFYFLFFSTNRSPLCSFASKTDCRLLLRQNHRNTTTSRQVN